MSHHIPRKDRPSPEAWDQELNGMERRYMNKAEKLSAPQAESMQEEGMLSHNAAPQRNSEISEALHEICLLAFDLTLAALTTDRVPEDIRQRAHAAHRKMLQYREKYTLRSRAEVERGERDPAIDNPNHTAFASAPAPQAAGEIDPAMCDALDPVLRERGEVVPDVQLDQWIDDMETDTSHNYGEDFRAVCEDLRICRATLRAHVATIEEANRKIADLEAKLCGKLSEPGGVEAP